MAAPWRPTSTTSGTGRPENGARCPRDPDHEAVLSFLLVPLNSMFSAMVDLLETLVCIDRSRLFAAGFSNGGEISYR